MREPTPLGLLLRQRRKDGRVSWKRLSAAVGLEPETMMMWERGATRDPPIGKVLLYAREVGITLDELAAAALPVSVEEVDPAGRLAAIQASAGVASARDKKRGSQTRRPRRDAP